MWSSTASTTHLAQFVTDQPAGGFRVGTTDERGETLRKELVAYYEVYGIRVGVFYRDLAPMAKAELVRGREGRGARGLQRGAPGPPQPRPGAGLAVAAPNLAGVASPVIRDGDVIAVVVTDSPTGRCVRRSCTAG